MTDIPKPFKIAFVFGTRPEAIKVAPVIRHMASLDVFEVITVLTAQHREMLDHVVDLFELPVTHDLDLMKPDQTLPALTGAMCEAVANVLCKERPECVLVQGDTTSCFVGALAAFYESIPVGHIEAGLRTHDYRQPFPEEMNRRLVGSMAEYHFAPSERAKQNLLKENVPADRVWVTGNSGIDALRLIGKLAQVAADTPLADALARCSGRLVTVTLHRRENLPFMTGIASALRDLVTADPGLHIIFPVHLSPKVRQAVMPVLQSEERCHLVDPLPYDQFVALMQRSDLLLTDSGGIQEEAAYLAKPVLVMRRKTERPEVVQARNVRLVGDDRKSIFDRTRELLEDSRERGLMAQASNPYGDGHTSERIAEILKEQLPAAPGGLDR